LSATLVAAAQPQAREIVERAQAALAEATVVRYEARGEVDGVLASRLPRMEGTVAIVASAGSDIPKLRIDARVVPPGQSEPVNFGLACDGTFVAVVEHGQKVFIRRALPIGKPLLNSVSPLWIREFGVPRALARETSAARLEYIGTEVVEDAECHVIHAVLAEDGGEVRWHFAISDYLPRRVQRIVDTPSGKSSITTRLRRLELKPSLPDDLFSLSRPGDFRDPTGADLLEVGSEAPDWTLRTADGQSVSLRELRGKVVLLDFWATWCGPCRIAMPILQRLHERYKGKAVAIYGVNCFERDVRADPAGFMRAAGFSYPLLLGGDRVAKSYRVQGIPTFYLIGPDGRIMMAASGLSADTEKQVESLLERLLGQTSPADG